MFRNVRRDAKVTLTTRKSGYDFVSGGQVSRQGDTFVVSDIVMKPVATLSSATPLHLTDSAQLRSLRQAAALTPLNGPGLVITLRDKPRASKSTSASIPGIVHDYDILQVVNELRAASAEGITVDGVRLTNSTSIHCIGPTIYVGQHPAKHPYNIEAVGNPQALQRALSAQGGIVRSLQQSGPDVLVKQARQLRLPPASSPTFRFGKPE